MVFATRSEKVPCLFEMHDLEPRRLLAVDLTARVTAFHFRGKVSAGTASAGQVTVVVSNKGPGVVPRSAGEILVAVKLRPSHTGGESDTLLAEVPVSVTQLAKGHAKSVKVPVVKPARLVGGSYSIVAIADSGDDLPETNEGNNTGISKAKLNVKAVHPDLAISQAFTTLSHANAESTTGMVILKNTGDVRLSGTVDIEFVAIPAGGAGGGWGPEGTIIGSVGGVKVNLARGRSKTVSNLSLTTPTNGAEPAVTFNIKARIVPHVKPIDLNTNNNSKSAGSVVVEGTPSVNYNPLSAAGLGTRLSFTRTGTETVEGGATGESGIVTDGAGHSGTYSLDPNIVLGTEFLSLDFPSSSLHFGFSFYRLESFAGLDGRTFDFSTSFDDGAVARLGVHVAYWLIPV